MKEMELFSHFRITLCTEDRGWFAEVVGIFPTGLGTRWTAIADDVWGAMTLASKLIGEMKKDGAGQHH